MAGVAGFQAQFVSLPAAGKQIGEMAARGIDVANEKVAASQ